MRRREFIALIGAVACPLSARAQQTGMPVVGFLGTVAQPVWTKPVAAFEQQLREHGWIDLAGKRLELLREVAPGRGRLAILVNAGYPAAKEELAQVQTAARALGLESVVLEIRLAEDIAAAPVCVRVVSGRSADSTA
jgi:ABC-type uncharacterized transport system substrate-binding protein